MAGTDQELLYLVDDEDRVIGSCRRGEAHRLGLRHRAVHILVFNAAGEVFLQKRSSGKDMNPGLWDTSAAGHVDYGESYDACATRELREELGIVLSQSPGLLFKIPASELTGWEFVQAYRVLHNGELEINEMEIEDGRWVAPDFLDSWLLASPEQLTTSFHTLWQTYRRSQHGG